MRESMPRCWRFELDEMVSGLVPQASAMIAETSLLLTGVATAQGGVLELVIELVDSPETGVID
jgi:hypothetical protein